MLNARRINSKVRKAENNADGGQNNKEKVENKSEEAGDDGNELTCSVR